MEDFNKLNTKAYRAAIVQKGGSMEMDRYIYAMEGEGLGNFFGSLLKQAVPLISSAIKGAAKAAKPIAASAGNELVSTGAKRGARELTRIVHSKHKNKKRKSKPWQGL